VCCAGILSVVPEWTDEGLESALVVNYLSRYLLGRLLLPALSRSPSGRLVLVANAGRYRDSLDFDDLQHRRGKPGLVVAARTQFANDLWAVELSERLQDSRVEVSCVFPGVVKTSLFQHATGIPRVARQLAPLVVALLGQSAEAAADTPSWLAHDEQAVGSGGRFYGPRRRPLRVPERARRRARRRQLWTASDDLVRGYLPPGLEPPAARSRGSAEQSAGTLWS
jgi:NAD(P)-dependent dehydrogenase (short-subunit alcohol dehydrogenase family)